MEAGAAYRADLAHQRACRGLRPRWCRVGVVVSRYSAQRAGKTLRLVEQFNEVCPVGTHVLYWPGAREGEGRKSITRSKAWLLGGHTPVVMVEGYAGGIALTHVMGYTPEVTP